MGMKLPNSKLDPTRAPNRCLGRWRQEEARSACPPFLIEGVGGGALAGQLQAVSLTQVGAVLD